MNEAITQSVVQFCAPMSAISPALAASTYILTKIRVSVAPDVTEYSVCDSTDTSFCSDIITALLFASYRNIESYGFVSHTFT